MNVKVFESRRHEPFDVLVNFIFLIIQIIDDLIQSDSII